MTSAAPASSAPAPGAAPAAAGSGAGAGSAQTAAALPGGIEIFKAGTHRDDAGRVHTFTPAMLAEMAATYNRALREAPLTVGHPKDNLPAYGWVGRVYVNDAGNLAVDPDQVDPAFAEMVRAGRFKKRSASFYPPGAPHNPTPGKWYLRHVAFLGAQPPAVAGLKDIGFAADADEVLSFAETFSDPAQPKEPPMSDADKAELEKLRADNKALADANAKAAADVKAANDAVEAAKKEAASFAEKAAADRRAGFVSFAEAEVKAGRLLPKDKSVCIATLETLAGAEKAVSFSEGATTTQVTALEMCAWLQGQMSSRKAAVSFSEQAGGAMGVSGAGFDARGKTDEEIDQAARRYQVDHPEVSYAEALGKVTTFTA